MFGAAGFGKDERQNQRIANARCQSWAKAGNLASMKRLACTGPGRVEWLEVEPSTPGQGEIRVVCEKGVEKHGTMMSFYKGVANSRGRWDDEMLVHRTGEGMLWGYPIPLGNMQAGRVVQAGPGAERFKEGERVFFHGFFQPETVLAEDSAWALPDSCRWKDAMLLDPGEFALGAIRDAGVRAGDRVAVFGLGAIGLVAVQMLRRVAGASWVAAFDTAPARLKAALECGADAALDPSTLDAGLWLKESTDGLGPDVVIDFSGALPALQAAIRGIAYGGTIAMGAFPAPWGPGLDLGGEAHMNRPRLVFTRACSDPNPDHPRWRHRRIQETVYQMIIEGRLDGEPIIGPIVPFDSLAEEYARVAGDPLAGIKLAVEYPA